MTIFIQTQDQPTEWKNGTNTFLTKVTAPDANNNSGGHSVSQSGDILGGSTL